MARHRLEPPRSAGRARRVVLAGVVVAALLSGTVLLHTGRYGGGCGGPGAVPVPSALGTGVAATGGDQTARRWERVLHRLNRLRAAAWRRGEPAALRLVYAPGSAALALDRRNLRSYAARGFTVRGLRLRIVTLRVIHHGRQRVRLDVVDRLYRAVATDAAGNRRALPRDRPHRQTIDLRRVHGRWRIAAIAVAGG